MTECVVYLFHVSGVVLSITPSLQFQSGRGESGIWLEPLDSAGETYCTVSSSRDPCVQRFSDGINLFPWPSVHWHCLDSISGTDHLLTPTTQPQHPNQTSYLPVVRSVLSLSSHTTHIVPRSVSHPGIPPSPFCLHTCEKKEPTSIISDFFCETSDHYTSSPPL